VRGGLFASVGKKHRPYWYLHSGRGDFNDFDEWPAGRFFLNETCGAGHRRSNARAMMMMSSTPKMISAIEMTGSVPLGSVSIPTSTAGNANPSGPQIQRTRESILAILGP